MKKIVPFNNLLTFETDVCEITSISLEHDIKKDSDLLSGVFYITGDYKITDGQLERLPFKFDLPFDIALSKPYNLDTLLVDIDDFRYELVGNNKLKVNIDLYIDGEVIEEPTDYKDNLVDLEDNISLDEEKIRDELDNIDRDNSKEEYDSEKEELTENITSVLKEERPDLNEFEEFALEDNLLNDMLVDKEKKMKEEKTLDEVNINNDNQNINTNTNENTNQNIFSNFNNDTNYVTYRVYRVLEGDNIDSIMKKYNISREELENYNDLENIIPGTKLIIPSND